MKRYWFILVVFWALAILVGCSEDSKKEAAKLEQEMMGGSQASDSVSASPGDTFRQATKPLDAAAVPVEESDYDIPSQPAGSGYTVQVASCESKEFARHLIKTYTDRGYEPYMTQVEVGGQTYYRIRIGNFSSKGEADRLKAELIDKYSISAWIDYNQ